MLRYKERYKILIALVMIGGLLASAYGLQRRIDVNERHSLSERLLLSLPSGDYVKSAALGFDALIADLLWAHTVVTVGEQLVSGQNYTGLYDALNTITILDARFHEVYHFGSILLGMQAGDVDSAITLLKKGIRNYPDDWRFYFIIAFYYTYYKGDDVRALRYFEKTAQLPGHPFYIARLIGNLYAKTGKIDVALAFLQEAYQQFKDEDMREEIQEKISDLLIQKHIVTLEDVGEKYKETYGTYPVPIFALVQAGLLPAIPNEPRGGEYVIHPQTGKAFSVKILFSFPLNAQKDLDRGSGISESLRNIFEENDISLSENVSVFVKEKDKQWVINDTDHEKEYTINKEENQLVVYSVKGEAL